MDFREATDELGAITHEQLAAALGCSVPTVRQARLDPSAKAHRSPPPGWEPIVAKLAESRARELTRLAAKLRGRT